MTNATPIATLWTALERTEPRYQRAVAIEQRLERQHGARSDHPRLRRATATVDAIGRRTNAIISLMMDQPAVSPSDLSLKAALGLRREDDPRVFQSLARDVLAMASAGFTARPRTGALLTGAQLAGAIIR